MQQLSKKLSKKFPLFRDFFFLIWKFGRIFLESITDRSVLLSNFENSVEVISVSGYKNVFCGYFDVTPFCPSDINNKIILHATNLSVYSEPSVSKCIDILIYDRLTFKAELVDKTYTWNWQQGARCQWLTETTIAYNQLIYGEVRCVIANICNNTKEILPINLSISHGNEYILSIDYFALSSGSEYGYPGLPYQLHSDEVKLYNLRSGQVTSLFSSHELDYLVSEGASKVHINHILPSPDGKYFVFIFRFWRGRARHDSLILYSFEEDKLTVLIENQTVSHFAWKNSSTLLAWLIVDKIPGYYWIDILNREIEGFCKFDDGHPNFINATSILSDVASSSVLGFPRLKLYRQDTESLQREYLLTLSHPTILTMGNRCDMHASLSKDKSEFQVDSRHIPHRRCVVIGKVN